MVGKTKEIGVWRLVGLLNSKVRVQRSGIDTMKYHSFFPAGDHKAHINRHAQRYSKHNTEQIHKRFTKEVPPWNGK